MAADLIPTPRLVNMPLDTLFEVRSGDFHAVSELDPGPTPLISCGTTDNGQVGNYEIPPEKTYKHAITVAYNGLPLTAKFHPYRFGAKDDVAVLIPRTALQDSTLLYMAAALNRMRWRYSYGRKCFRAKLQRLAVLVPVVTGQDGIQTLDEAAIADLFPKNYRTFLPKKSSTGISAVPPIRWKSLSVQDLFTYARGDFHSITDLALGPYKTVSRVTTENGIVGSFERPDGAAVYGQGHITVSTVGADAFVQLDEFIATDNVIVCAPKMPVRITTLYFMAFALNYQKWRYSYGRQCYMKKFGRIHIYLPVTADDQLDEEAMERIVTQTSYWAEVRARFPETILAFATLEAKDAGDDAEDVEQLTLPLEEAGELGEPQNEPLPA